MNIFLFGGILLFTYVEVVTSKNGCGLGSVCAEHGLFIPLLFSNICQCHHGFTGICCETNIDECVSNPCQYGGACQDGFDGYNCSCKDGFDGVNCEKEKNECASNPCVNGATCVDLFNRFKCDCLDGDSGKFCEIGPNVTVAPKIQLISEKTVVEGTHDLEIACYAQGIPTPVVTWEEIDAKFQPNVRQIGHFLVIENVTMADKGYYTCTAKNRVGTDIKVVSIIVNAKNTRPFIAPLISTSSTVIVKYYTDATLFCNVTGYPKPSVKWEYQKNRTIPGAKIAGGWMLIPNVTKETTGLYTCKATNIVGSSQANIMLETTYDYPTFLTSPRAYSGNAGTSHNFTCITTGHPAPTITWTFSSFSHQIDTLPPHKIYSHGDVLELVNMQVSGTLTCTATNEFGLDTATATVIIHHSSAVVG